jgi:hypothetical protein
MKTMQMSVAIAATLCLLCACPPATGSGTSGEGEGEGEPINSDCPDAPADGITVCDVQSTGSPNHPRIDDTVVLGSVVATSPRFVFDTDNDTGEVTLYAVFVSDVPTAEYGGVLVTYFADIANMPPAIAVGDVLRIEGVYTEDSVSAANNETRVRATSIAATGTTAAAAPLQPNPADLGDDDDGEPFEGTLVTFANVEVSALQQYFFTLNNGVNVSGKIFRYGALVGEQMSSITGVVQYDVFEGGYLLTPRFAADIVTTFRPELETVTVTALNDGTIQRCASDEFADACNANIRAVVTGGPQFISTNANDGPRFGFYVADPDNVDAEGRLQGNSGVFVNITPQNMRFPVTFEGGYTFAQNADRGFDPGTAPEVGDIVVISGQNSTSRFDNSEFRFVSYLSKEGTGDAPLPALFDGSLPTSNPRHPSKLKGGRPAADGNWGTADGFTPALEDVTPAGDIEQWEGVLVQVINAEITTPCYAVPVNNVPRDFGNFLITGDVEVGRFYFLEQSFSGRWVDVPEAQQTCANVANKCGDSRVQDLAIGVTGLVQYDFSVHRIMPRTVADIDAPFSDETCN